MSRGSISLPEAERRLLATLEAGPMTRAELAWKAGLGGDSLAPVRQAALARLLARGRIVAEVEARTGTRVDLPATRDVVRLARAAEGGRG